MHLTLKLYLKYIPRTQEQDGEKYLHPHLTALSTMVKIWKQIKYPRIDDWAKYSKEKERN